ncbi:MAG: diguanylate cyclase [Acidobacteria bacterium]|nr:diguanylate cyclase [Acidobacteriota bacterium]
MEPSLVNLAIQMAGIGLMAALSYLLLQSIPRVALRYWTAAWSCLTIALASLLLSFTVPPVAPVLQPIYLLAEYAFGYLFIAGCQAHVTGIELTRRHFVALGPGLLLSVMLPWLGGGDLNIFFVPHTAILACFFYAAYCALRPARQDARRGPGLRVTSVALLLLTFNFLQYVPIFTYAALNSNELPVAYLHYTSLYDLILEILLGFGTVMLVTESVRRELEAAHVDVMRARDRLEVMARMDPLTESLNRHAFYSLVEKNRGGAGHASGSVAVVDLNDLKTINDTYGHHAGDVAIRTAARAIRSLIRADDLLFRWGGDEFLVLLFGLPASEARLRFERLNHVLAEMPLPGFETPVTVGTSYGIAGFALSKTLDQVIDEADGEMYLEKQRRRKDLDESRQQTPGAAAIPRLDPAPI